MTEPPADAPRREDAVLEPHQEALRCWRCGSPHDRYQEYCLECGARLVPLAGAGATWRRETWTRDSPFWFWATFLALLLIALGAGAIVLAATNGDDERGERREASGPTTSVIGAVPPVTTTTELPDTIQLPPATDTVPTLPPATDTGTTTTPPPPPPPPTTPPPPPPPAAGASGEPIDWPSRRSGYTVILRSIPHARGRTVAEGEAARAIDAGLLSVGVLNSSNYSSLVAGYYVVFTGVYDTETEAVAALPEARRSGYPVAYIREITE